MGNLNRNMRSQAHVPIVFTLCLTTALVCNNLYAIIVLFQDYWNRSSKYVVNIFLRKFRAWFPDYKTVAPILATAFAVDEWRILSIVYELEGDLFYGRMYELEDDLFFVFGNFVPGYFVRRFDRCLYETGQEEKTTT